MLKSHEPARPGTGIGIGEWGWEAEAGNRERCQRDRSGSGKSGTGPARPKRKWEIGSRKSGRNGSSSLANEPAEEILEANTQGKDGGDIFA